jgi:hypothetical protein
MRESQIWDSKITVISLMGLGPEKDGAGETQ